MRWNVSSTTQPSIGSGWSLKYQTLFPIPGPCRSWSALSATFRPEARLVWRRTWRTAHLSHKRRLRSRSAARQLVESTQCGCFCQDFRTRARVLQHLRTRKSTFATLVPTCFRLHRGRVHQLRALRCAMRNLVLPCLALRTVANPCMVF